MGVIIDVVTLRHLRLSVVRYVDPSPQLIQPLPDGLTIVLSTHSEHVPSYIVVLVNPSHSHLILFTVE